MAGSFVEVGVKRVVLVLLLGSLVVRCGGRASENGVLPREPHLGLACRGASPCHRIGLAVWLAREAQSVRATVDRHAVKLRTGLGAGAYRRGLFWRGFFTDSRAQRFADEYPHDLSIEIRAVEMDGGVHVAQTSAPVSGGYG